MASPSHWELSSLLVVVGKYSVQRRSTKLMKSSTHGRGGFAERCLFYEALVSDNVDVGFREEYILHE